MIKNTETHILYVFQCPLCNRTHICENQAPKLLESWYDKCDVIGIDIQITNTTFVDTV